MAHLTSYIILGLIGAVLLIGLILIIYKSARRSNKSKFERSIDKIKKDVDAQDKIPDWKKDTSEIIEKFHYYIGFPHDVTGLTRDQRRRVKRHYTKFLWNWHLLPKKRQSVTMIVKYLAKTPRNKFVFWHYMFPEKNDKWMRENLRNHLEKNVF